MFCKNCGNNIKDNQKFCTSCGIPFSSISNIPKTVTPSIISHKKSFLSAGKIITIFVVLIMIGVGIYNSLDKESVTKNNDAMTSFNSGDTKGAINQFQQATQNAVTNDTKMDTLINLGYVYSTELQYEKAQQSFKEALGYAKVGSFKYFLISGEIALLSGNPNSAQINYNKAYELNSNDFQINNALAVFYLDLEEVATDYVDYPRALQYAKKAYELSEINFKNIAKQNLAIAYYFNENYDQTISLLSQYDFNKFPYAALWLGLAYVNKEDHINAKIYLQKAVNGGAEVPQEINDYLNSN